MNLFVHTEDYGFVDSAIISIVTFAKFGIQVRFDIAVVKVRIDRVIQGIDLFLWFLLGGLWRYQVRWVEILMTW
jgi:hypothetical protein